MSGQTSIQRHWLDLLQSVELAQRQLDPDTFEVFLALLVTYVARLGRQQLEREWRRAA